MHDPALVFAVICAALDTASDACSAALWIDGELFQRFEVAPRRHAELLLPMLDAVLLEAGVRLADCDALAFGRGPGSFTGVRIAASTAQGIAFAANLSVAPVSDLAALALQAARSCLPDSPGVRGSVAVCAAFDARIGEIYAACYRVTESDGDYGASVEPLTPEWLGAPMAFQPPDLPAEQRWVGAGGGWAAHPQALAERLEPVQVFAECLPRAAEVAWLGAEQARLWQLLSAEFALPVYLRDQVARQKF